MTLTLIFLALAAIFLTLDTLNYKHKQKKAIRLKAIEHERRRRAIFEKNHAFIDDIWLMLLEKQKTENLKDFIKSYNN